MAFFAVEAISLKLNKKLEIIHIFPTVIAHLDGIVDDGCSSQWVKSCSRASFTND